MKSVDGFSNYERFVAPTLDALRALGGSGRPAEVKEWLYKELEVTESEQQERTSP
jgi:hypothetical protein